jgi:D-alanyl-D-alanine endopeptidase (penicillin-binding protein 7)
MVKSALGILFSLISVVFVVPAMAAEGAETAATEKVTTQKAAPKKPVVAKRRTKFVGKRHSAARNRTVHKNKTNASLDSREKLVKKVVLVHGRHKTVYQRVAYTPVIPAVPPVLSAGDLAGLNLTRDPLALKSNAVLVLDQSTSEVLLDKNSQVALPIASITKLMTSMVVVESNQNMDEVLSVTNDDVDREKFSHSRLRVGSQLTRANMLHIALMSSENRAASALGRNYPGGLPAFVAAMNAKAKALGMVNTHYADSTGLSRNNVASARDLAKLVIAAHQHPIIRQYSTDSKYVVDPGGPALQYKNSNHLVENPQWEIGLQKTGYINEAGRCLVMQAKIEGRPIVMVFLDSKGKQSRLADAGRIRKWIEANKTATIPRTVTAQQS